VARAEEERPKQEEMQKVEIKGSAAKYDARRDDTASKTVVSAEEIQKYGDTSVNDVLKRLPGITVGGAAGAAARSACAASAPAIPRS
jgi:outer membrane receptor for Fe3+-dicitrate